MKLKKLNQSLANVNSSTQANNANNANSANIVSKAKDANIANSANDAKNDTFRLLKHSFNQTAASAVRRRKRSFLPDKRQN